MALVKVILGFPRTGTHFVWSRYIKSGKYQLMYDADVIPALTLLSKKYDGMIRSFYPPPINPHYNFQFDSLSEINEPKSLSSYMDYLFSKYNADSNFDLFNKILLRQDADGRNLLVINRFIYTNSYQSVFDNNYEWNIDDAINSLHLFYEWSKKVNIKFKWLLIHREISEWVISQRRLKIPESTIQKRMSEYNKVLCLCKDLNIKTYDMNQVINTINSGYLDFDDVLANESLCINYCSKKKNNLIIVNKKDYKNDNIVNNAFHYMKRTFEYLTEKDRIKRTSLVRSIGGFSYIFKLPLLRTRFNYDYDGIALNNAKITIMKKSHKI